MSAENELELARADYELACIEKQKHRACPNSMCESCDIGIAVVCIGKQLSLPPIEKLEVQPIMDDNGAYVGADDYIYYVCPTCGEFVGCEGGELDNYCSGCGQKIMKDWSKA